MVFGRASLPYRRNRAWYRGRDDRSSIAIASVLLERGSSRVRAVEPFRPCTPSSLGQEVAEVGAVEIAGLHLCGDLPVLVLSPMRLDFAKLLERLQSAILGPFHLLHCRIREIVRRRTARQDMALDARGNTVVLARLPIERYGRTGINALTIDEGGDLITAPFHFLQFVARMGVDKR